MRIPNGVAKELEVAEGKSAQLEVKGRSLIVTPVQEKPKYDLAEMIAAITPENLHGAIDTGDPLGNETL